MQAADNERISLPIRPIGQYICFQQLSFLRRAFSFRDFITSLPAPKGARF
jgi:hypothetical protein